MHSQLGHRQRVKARFRAEGLDNFEEVHALELLLFYAVPRRDTKDLARRLLDHFGSLSRVLEADAEALEKVEGVGFHVSTFLRLINETNRYYTISRDTRFLRLRSNQDIGKYLASFFHGKNREAVYMLCLDAACRPICCRQLGEGSVSSIGLTTRQVVETALGCGATSVALAHNHPAGICMPSNADISTTRRLATALATVEVTLVDHVVVSDGNYVSMVHLGIYDPNSR